jgi:hypothetical protein
MNSILGRLFATLRVFFGLNDPAENHLQQPHGWLLPALSRARSAEPRPAEGVSTAPPAGLRR